MLHNYNFQSIRNSADYIEESTAV